MSTSPKPLAGLTIKSRLRGVSMKFFNYFLNFGLNNVGNFTYKNKKIITGLKSIDFEQHKLEQLRWVSSPETQQRLKRFAVDKIAFVNECKKRIIDFIDSLDSYASDEIDLSKVSEDGFKVTIQSVLRPRPRADGFGTSSKKDEVPLHHRYVSAVLLSLLKAQGLGVSEVSINSLFKPVNPKN